MVGELNLDLATKSRLVLVWTKLNPIPIEMKLSPFILVNLAQISPQTWTVRIRKQINKRDS